jgi:hypothetical protein
MRASWKHLGLAGERMQHRIQGKQAAGGGM